MVCTLLAFYGCLLALACLTCHLKQRTLMAYICSTWLALSHDRLCESEPDVLSFKRYQDHILASYIACSNQTHQDAGSRWVMAAPA